MQFLSLCDARLGRWLVPTRPWTPTNPGFSVAAEFWLNQRVPYLRSNETASVVMRVLTDQDIGTLVPGLLPNQTVPLSAMPPEVQQLVQFNALYTVERPALVGEIRMWAGHPLRVPPGWLICDGSFVSKTTYADLFEVIGNAWGRPANDQFFALPNLLGRVPLGAAPADAFVGTGRVHKVVVHHGGSGYAPGAHVVTGLNVSAPAMQLVAAQLRIHVAPSGSVSHVEVINGGVYQSVGLNPDTTQASDTLVALPPGAWSPPGSAGVKYSIHFVGTAAHHFAWGIRVTNRGMNYTSDPEVILSGGSLSGATARAIRSIHNDILGVVITNPGNGQFAGASVTITGGGGSGATAELVSYPTPVAVGDLGGEHWRRQLTPELAPHTHDYETPMNATARTPGGGNVWDDNRSVTQTSSTGAALAMPMLPAFAGVVFIIRHAP